jgi:hypothetical protein
VADALDTLADDADNQAAWTLFRQCVTRFTVDTHLAGVVYQRMTGELSADAFAVLTARCTLLYDTLYPPSKTES